jgi:predicted lysophospholipase L1 biosynthesis ABC-type transport system permease subunit
VLVYQVLPVFGIFLLAASLLGVVVVLLPRGWKASVRMALRNLGRRRARTLTTMLALFIGVYGIGLIVGLGHDVLTQTSSVVNQNAPYNLVTTASGNESNALQASLSTIPGLTSHREDLFVSSVPRAIDGRPIQQVLGKNLQGEIGVLAPAPVVNALSTRSNAGTTVFYMKVPPAQVNQALDTLGRIAPHAAVQNLTHGATAFLQEFSRLLNMLVAIALLSVLAGVIIIANAVALAMLERRRELGILKSVGYTSGTVMREILLENGIIGGVSSFIAMLLASSAVARGGKQFFH